MKTQRTIIDLTDDFDGSDGAETVEFAFDGVRYEIELSDVNRKEMYETLAPYVDRARRVGGRKPARAKAKAKPKTNGDAAEVRAWAGVNGVEVPERGRIPASVRKQYEAASR